MQKSVAERRVTAAHHSKVNKEGEGNGKKKKKKVNKRGQRSEKEEFALFSTPAIVEVGGGADACPEANSP